VVERERERELGVLVCGGPLGGKDGGGGKTTPGS